MIRNHIKHHRVASYAIVAAGAMLLVIATVLISNPTSITFRSEAQSENENVSIPRSAQASIDVSSDQLPTCVKRISYIGNNQNIQESCLVSIQCQEALTNNPEGCTVSHGVSSCYRENECLMLTDWIRNAQKMCGC